MSQLPAGEKTKPDPASSKGPDKQSTKLKVSNRPPKGSGDLVKLSYKYSSLGEMAMDLGSSSSSHKSKTKWMAQIVQWNCRGFRANYNELSLLMCNLEPIAFCLQELLLSDSQTHMYLTIAIITYSPVYRSWTAVTGLMASLSAKTYLIVPYPE